MKILSYDQLIKDWRECFGENPSPEVEHALKRITTEQLERLATMQQCAK